MDKKFTEEQLENFMEFVLSDDLDFYEKYILNLTDEEQMDFFRNNPAFMSGYKLNPLKADEGILMLKDKMFRGLIRKIGKTKEENG